MPFSEMGRKERKGRIQEDSGGNSLCYLHAKFKVSISHSETMLREQFVQNLEVGGAVRAGNNYLRLIMERCVYIHNTIYFLSETGK